MTEQPDPQTVEQGGGVFTRQPAVLRRAVKSCSKEAAHSAPARQLHRVTGRASGKTFRERNVDVVCRT
jgi:hypothetical protein